ncbi:MAG TPA: hypothetical protein VNU01_08995, partial [Egibacteraceae bacterium]|nr:hypothetical protein [Egibacteraceae bacterium]
MKAGLAALLSLAIALALAGCSTARLGGAAGRLTQGETVMVQQGDGWRALAAGDSVPDGARVRTGLETARLELQRGELWLGHSATVRLRGDDVEVERGEIVLHSQGARASWQAVEVTGEGVFRLAPGASPRVGVYAGEVTVARPGEQRRLPALRQLGLAARRLPAEPDPLYYDTGDDWDRELLPKAISFDEEVSRLARGIDREYGTDPQPADFYTSFTAVRPETVPVLAATARRADADGSFGPPSDALVTLFVSSAVAAAQGLAIEDAVRRVADKRAVGARWGLIAVEEDIDVQRLAAAVDLARERRQIVAPDDERTIG